MLIYLYVWSEYIYNGESPKFENFFVMGQWKRLVATQKKKSKLWRHSKLINMDQTNNWTSSYTHEWTYYHQGFWNLEEDLLKKNGLTTWCNYNIAWSNNSLIIAWSSPRLCSSTTWNLLPGLKFEALNALHWHICEFNLRTCLGPILKFIACHFYSWELMNIPNVCISLQHPKLMKFFIMLANFTKKCWI